MSRFSFLFAIVLANASLPAVAEGKVPLAEEPHINTQLIAAAVGDVIRKTCPTISARILVVLGKMNALENYAEEKGYTDEEVDAFFKNRAEKARIKAAAADYLSKAGAVPGDVESYCVAGRGEIDKGTLVGSLLRSSE